MSAPRLEGRVALVTGAARGQGRSHAVRLAEEGADIVAVDLCGPVDGVRGEPATPAELADTVTAVERLGRRIVAREADVRDLEAMRRAAADGIAELGRLDVVVANAAVLISGRWDTITPQDWQTVIDVNLTGTWNTIMATAPHLVEADAGGSIILISSAAGLKGLPFMNPYTAAKHGVTGLARSFAHELAPHRIRVNSVHPCGVDTEMGYGASGAGILAGAEAQPTHGPMLKNSLPVSLIPARDVSEMIVFLAADESRYVTASAMTIDAGNTQF